MKAFRNALLCLTLICTLLVASPLAGLAEAEETTTPTETIAPIEEDASVENESSSSDPETQCAIDEYVKQEHEHMQDYIAWSQAQWAAHIERTTNFWKNHHNHKDIKTESSEEGAKHPFTGSDISEHIRQSADRLVDHIEQAEKRLLDHVQRTGIHLGETKEAE